MVRRLGDTTEEVDDGTYREIVDKFSQKLLNSGVVMVWDRSARL